MIWIDRKRRTSQPGHLVVFGSCSQNMMQVGDDTPARAKRSAKLGSTHFVGAPAGALGLTFDNLEGTKYTYDCKDDLTRLPADRQGWGGLDSNEGGSNVRSRLIRPMLLP